MTDNLYFPLSFIGGAAILTNASAILQNGITMRYNLAITQWREFRASLAAHDDRLSEQYANPSAAVVLAERRIILQLRGLGLINAAVASFAATTVLSLVGSFLVQLGSLSPTPVNLITVTIGGVGLFFILATAVTFFFEGACGRALLLLHLQYDGSIQTAMPNRGINSDDI